MRKLFLVMLLLVIYSSSIDARQVNCQSDAFSALSDAGTELEACREGCPSSGYCEGFCQAYYDLQVDDIISDYSVCMNSSFA